MKMISSGFDSGIRYFHHFAAMQSTSHAHLAGSGNQLFWCSMCRMLGAGPETGQRVNKMILKSKSSRLITRKPFLRVASVILCFEPEISDDQWR